jgi:hypothetical protein
MAKFENLQKKKRKKNELPANNPAVKLPILRCSQECHFKVGIVWLISRRLLTPNFGFFGLEFGIFWDIFSYFLIFLLY